MSSGGGSPATRAPDDAPLDALIESGGLSCVYEPLVDLHSGAVLGHEALLRGPMGTPWRSPLVLLAAARHADRLVELETHSLCTSLLDAARAAGSPPLTLFVNVEPATLARGLPTIITLLEGRARHVQVVVEITERALAEDPDAMMTAADRLRAVGCAIALDDVGAEPASLALMPMLSPEVVKLDLQLLRTVTDPETILVSASVRDFAAATGAEVVAEGVETTADLTRAHALGATIGQGWWWSRELHELGGSTHRPERFRARLPAGIPRLSPRRASLHAAPAVPTQPEAPADVAPPPEPSPARAADAAPIDQLTRLVYHSRIVDLGGGGLPELLRGARERNGRRGLTGALLVDRDVALQCLEGSRDLVTATFLRIAADPRHTAVTLMSVTDIDERDFPDWTMGYVSATREVREALERVAAVSAFTPQAMSAESAVALMSALRAQHWTA